MSKKRISLLLFIFSIVTIMVFLNKKCIVEQLIERFRVKFNKQIESEVPIYFGHKSIDSLYNINAYIFFLFIPNKTCKIPSQNSIETHMTLKLYNSKNHEIQEIGAHALILPSCIFDFMSSDGSVKYYRIMSVDKNIPDRHYLYKLQTTH